MTSNTVYMILFILVIIILLIGIVPIYDFIRGPSQDKICQLSVLQQAATKTFGTSNAKLQCPRKTVIFHQDYVEVNNKKADVYEKANDKSRSNSFNALDNFIVNQVIADQMYRCWTNIGQGKVDVFNTDFIHYMNFQNKRNICLICSQLEFDRKTVRQNDFSGLMDFLKAYPVSMSSGMKNDMTAYYNYLSSQKYTKTVGGIWWPFGKYKSFDKGYIGDAFSQDKSYAIFILAGKSPWIDHAVSSKFFSKNIDYYSIHIMDYEKMISDNVCDYIYN